MNEFKIWDRVEIIKTNSILDGKTALIVGIQKQYLVNNYILFLEKLIKEYDPAIIMIGSCIKHC